MSQTLVTVFSPKGIGLFSIRILLDVFRGESRAQTGRYFFRYPLSVFKRAKIKTTIFCVPLELFSVRKQFSIRNRLFSVRKLLNCFQSESVFNPKQTVFSPKAFELFSIRKKNYFNPKVKKNFLGVF